MLIRTFIAAQFLFCAAVSAATPPVLTVEYAATRIVETDQGSVQGSIVATPVAERSEMRIGEMSTVVILLKDKKQGYLLMPAQKLYQVLDFVTAARQAGSAAPEQLDFNRVGEEVLSGQPVIKYKVVMKDRSGGGFLWYTSGGIPVKMDWLTKAGQEQSRMTVTLNDIQIGKQDQRAFEVPEGFTRLPSGVPTVGAITTSQAMVEADAARPSDVPSTGGDSSVMTPASTGTTAQKRASADAPVSSKSTGAEKVPTKSTGASIGGEVLDAALGAATQTGSAKVTGNVGRVIDDPVGRSAGQAGTRALLGRLSGLLRKKQ